MPSFRHSIVGVVFLLLVSAGLPARAEVKLGESPGPLSVIDAAGDKLEIKSDPKRAATALVFLSARSEAVEKTLTYINLLHRKHCRLRVLYLGICSNDVESPEELQTFARQQGMIFTIYRDPQAAVAKQLGITSVPSVALLDQSGKLVHRGGLENEGGLLALDAAVTSATTSRETAKTDGIVSTPIDQPGPKHDHADQFGSLSFSSELIFEKIPEAVAFHCSTFAEAANGDLLCLWYGGSYESADDQALFLSRRHPGEREWQKPRALVTGPKPLPGNGVIFVDGKQRVWIVWCRMESVRPIGRGQGWDECRLMYRTSSDHGVTWSKDAEFLRADLRGVPRNPPLRRLNGHLVLPVEATSNGVEGSAFLIGEVGGEKWRVGGFTSGGSQPAVIERKDGSLFALMRKYPRLTQIESNDGGESWTEAAPSTLRNPDAGITMTKLANGHLVVVFNDSETSRTPLSVARSLDEGRTWEMPLQLESNPGEYSYPCVQQTRDGKIHVTYTYRRYSIKHVEFNEDWLVHLERPN